MKLLRHALLPFHFVAATIAAPQVLSPARLLLSKAVRARKVIKTQREQFVQRRDSTESRGDLDEWSKDCLEILVSGSRVEMDVLALVSGAVGGAYRAKEFSGVLLEDALGELERLGAALALHGLAHA